MKTAIFFMALVAAGCDDEEGIWISESCRAHEAAINWGVNRMNTLEEREVIWIEGFKKSDPDQPIQKALNDDTDYFYCRDDTDRPYLRGHTNYGSGDIYLYTKNFVDQDILRYLPCTILHELGHRYLSLRDNDVQSTIMYRYLVDGCLDKTEWE
jgi:hypothetical protein